MSEPRFIADTCGVQLLEDGTVCRGDSEPRGDTGVDLMSAALIAEAIKMAKIELSAEIEQEGEIRRHADKSFANRLERSDTMHRDANKNLEDDLSARIESMETKLEREFERRIRAMEALLTERIEAVERYQEHCMKHVARLDRKRQDLGNRVAADESAFREDVQALFHRVSALEVDGASADATAMTLDGVYGRLDALEARQQGEARDIPGRAAVQEALGQAEAGEGEEPIDELHAVNCTMCNRDFVYKGEGFLCESCSKRDEEETRRETAKEIAGRLRCEITGGSPAQIAEWIEREYEKEER